MYSFFSRKHKRESHALNVYCIAVNAIVNISICKAFAGPTLSGDDFWGSWDGVLQGERLLGAFSGAR